VENKKESYIAIGKMGAPWGLRGEVKLHLYNPDSDLLNKTHLIYIKVGFSFQKLRLQRFRLQGKSYLLKMKDCDSPEAAQELKGLEVFIPQPHLSSKAPNEWYVYELIGMRIKDEAGIDWGKVQAMNNYGAGDILTVVSEKEDKNQEYLIPWTSEVIVKVDEGLREIVIRKLEGLLED